MALTINHQTNDISATSGSVTIDGASAGGGAWNLISTTTVSSAASSVAFTSIGSYNRHVLLFDCTFSSSQIPNLQIYDNGTLTTSSDYAMFRYNLSSSSGGALTYSGWIGSGGVVSAIGKFELVTAAPRATMQLIYGGFTGTNDTANHFISTGGMDNQYSITDIDGINFTTTSGTAVISSGRFSLYGLSQ